MPYKSYVKHPGGISHRAGVDEISSTNFSARYARWIALACLVVPMFASYFFDDMFSSVSFLFNTPELMELGWDSAAYGMYAGGYSVLCVFGGLVICGMLLDRWGVRITGSIFVGMMLGGAALVAWAITSGLAPEASLAVAYVGCMLFGLGSEIAGVAVTRSIAKWFKGGPMALAMGLQLAVARLGTAAALVLSPMLVASKAPGEVYRLAETARPAFFGLMLMAAGVVLWAVFVMLDAKADARGHAEVREDSGRFHFRDVLQLLKNPNFVLIALLCVFFYSSIVAFKKFAGAILIPRFDIPVQTAGWMISMLPFATVVFAPVFGILVDKAGRGTRWMTIGAVLALAAHVLLAFAPAGVPLYGYLSMIFLGFAYSLVPAAMWPSVPKIVPEKILGTSYALIYWVQNLGLMLFKMISGEIIAKADSVASSAVGEVQSDAASAISGAVSVEIMYVAVCLVALGLAMMLRRSSRKNPALALDLPNSA